MGSLYRLFLVGMVLYPAELRARVSLLGAGGQDPLAIRKYVGRSRKRLDVDCGSSPSTIDRHVAQPRPYQFTPSAAFDQGTFVFANPRHASRRRASAPVIAWACQPVIAALAVKLSEDTAPSPPSSDAVVTMSL